MYNLVEAKNAKRSFNPDLTNEMVGKYMDQKGDRRRCNCGESRWELANPLYGMPKGKVEFPVAITCSACGEAAKLNYLQVKKYYMG